MADKFIPQPVQSSVIARNPQTTIIIASVRWDNKYKHVRRFSSKSSLYTYVNSNRVVAPITQSTQLKLGDNSIRVPHNQMVAERANYIAYQNLPNDSTWYYGFITSIRPQGDNSSVITVEPDYFQNNFYDLTIRPCFVVREHIAKSADVRGANTVPEGIECGDYTYFANGTIPFGTRKLLAYLSGQTPSKGRIVNNIFSGIDQVDFNCQTSADVGVINDFIDGFSENPDVILGMTMYNSICDPASNSVEGSISANGAFGSYTPNNAKMYTYPYCYVVADDNRGGNGLYKFEYSTFGSSTTVPSIRLRSRGFRATAPSVVTNPTDYKGQSECFPEGFSTTNFAQVAWTTDSFQAYLAQNRSTLALSGIGAVVNTVGNAAVGNLPGAVIGAGSIGSVVAQTQDNARMPDRVKGKVTDVNIATNLGRDQVDMYGVAITPEMARRIDSYFSCYGYKTMQVKTPNLNNRSSWNYVETKDCTFWGAMDKDSLQRIRDIFNSGVTLWHTNDIGNYNLTNS